MRIKSFGDVYISLQSILLQPLKGIGFYPTVCLFSFASLAANQVEYRPGGGKLFYADIPKIDDCPLTIKFQDRAPPVFTMVDVLSKF
jgi:hypothetical protein